MRMCDHQRHTHTTSLNIFVWVVDLYRQNYKFKVVKSQKNGQCTIQWDLSITDTLGPNFFACNTEVFLFER